MRTFPITRLALVAVIAAGRAACGGSQPGRQATPAASGPGTVTTAASLFRFPFGDADARTIAIANQAGYVPVRWTVDTLGWEGTAGHIAATVVASRVLGAARPGEIVGRTPLPPGKDPGIL